jgi:hypothetical protein
LFHQLIKCRHSISPYAHTQGAFKTLVSQLWLAGFAERFQTMNPRQAQNARKGGS